MDVNAPRDVGVAVRGRRKDLGMSQADLAARAGVSRRWLSAFEAGKPSVELGIVLKVLDALGLRLSVDHPLGHDRPQGEAATDKTADLDAYLADFDEGDA